MSVDLSYFLTLSAGLFGIGCFGMLSKRSALAVLLSAELMLTGANLALVAFTRFGAGAATRHAPGAALALFASVSGAAEFALGAVIVVVIYRSRRTVWVDDYDLKG